MTKKRVQQLVAIVCSGAMMLSAACALNRKAPALPTYDKQDFVFFGFWSPYDFTEESYALYRQSGLNTMLFTNHSVQTASSDNLHYLGSGATMRSLELCRKTGLNAILNYGWWYYEWVEGGKSYGDTPFSDYNLYEDYKDMIVGVHIADEPKYNQIDDYAKESLIADYKRVYDVPYMLNLYPSYAGQDAIGYEGYKQYVQSYADKVLTQFDDNRLLSVDFYPFRASSSSMHSAWLACYNNVASVAKSTGSKQSYYIQTAVGNEFQGELGQDEICMQLNVAMAFGADWFGFYCYEMPRTYLEDGTYEPMYSYCMLNPDGTPSLLYYAVQSEIARVSAFSDAYLAYDWVKTVPVTPAGAKENYALKLISGSDFSGTSIEQVTADSDTVVGCFTSEKGEAFMVVNYGTPSEKKTSTTTVKVGCDGYAAVYGKSGAPEIVKLKKGELQLEMASGEGRFVTLL